MSETDAEFEALLDKLGDELAAVEEETPTEAHKWETERSAVFAGEATRFRCGKCFVRLEVSLEESINAAMDRQSVNRNCAEQLLKEIDEY